MESLREDERVAREHYDLTLHVDIFSKLISCTGEINKGHELMRRLTTRNPTLSDSPMIGYGFPTCGGGVNPYPNVLGIHNSGGPRGVALTTSKLNPFLPSVALRDRQLRLPLFIDAGLIWCVRTGASGAYALAPISTLGVPPKAIGAYALALGCVRTGSRNDLLGFVCNLLVHLDLFSHFHSELCLLKPETLERTHQGIMRNGKRFKAQ
ncbi:hypothetical protein PIB30_101206 [Stylosanthes scabra]|uniref:Uncharacterized protein n=1 Tax=Stylosanthes scabra TaxID=79078 RepID=A0ABU6SY47_9FABA|nr:hypothetical protein [Stylosanthes scabra]